MSEELKNETSVSEDESLQRVECNPIPGLTAAMEIAGVESIYEADAKPVILGFKREEF